MGIFDAKLIPELVRFKEQTYNEAVEIFENSRYNDNNVLINFNIILIFLVA